MGRCIRAYDDRVSIAGGAATRRSRLYDAYASTHAGRGGSDAAALVYRRDIRPLLPDRNAGPVLDIGCGQGALVAQLVADGFDGHGVDVSPEQVALAHTAGIATVELGEFGPVLAARQGSLAAVVATDVLEHLTKDEVIATFDDVRAALGPDGVFVARVPNAGSPFSGRIRYGDFTHETSYTARSVRQLAAATGFDAVDVSACPPVAHGVKSALRVAVWQPVSAAMKLALAAETGELRGHLVTQNITFRARVAPGGRSR